MDASARYRHDITNASRIALRRLNDCDLPAIADLLSRPEMFRYSRRGPVTSPGEVHEWHRVRSEPPSYNFAVLLRPEPAAGCAKDDPTDWPCIGVVGCSRGPPEVGYYMNPDYWGKGYMSEALIAFVKHFWVDGPRTRSSGGETEESAGGATWDHLDVRVIDGNDASIRVAEKAGFARTGGGRIMTEGPGKGQMDVEFRIQRPVTRGTGLGT